MNKKSYDSYNDYLSLNEVLTTSNFVGDDIHQLNFVISHQVTELWTKLLIAYLKDFSTTVNSDSLIAAESISRQMYLLWEVLEHIPVSEFLRFRDSLQGISGAESNQFSQINKYILQSKDICQQQDCKSHIHILSRIDSNLRKWKLIHLQITEKLIGHAAGTGGSTGASHLKEKGAPALINHDDLKKSQ